MVLKDRSQSLKYEPGLLEVRGLRQAIDGKLIWNEVNFDLRQGERIFIRGPSGCGKTLLLRCVAGLDKQQAGSVHLAGKSPEVTGFPAWRAQVAYVLQARVALRGTPEEFYFSVQRFGAQRGRPRGDLPALLESMGLEQRVLNQQWTELSGGQAQRVMLAIAIALKPAVLLLDEPTSACDPATARKVEATLASCGASLVWVSHDPEQPARVGGRVLDLPTGQVYDLPPPMPSRPPSPAPHQQHSNGSTAQPAHSEHSAQGQHAALPPHQQQSSATAQVMVR